MSMSEKNQIIAAPPDHAATPARRILAFREVDSTNSRALSIGGDGTVVIAERQTAGRGRHNRAWHSAPGLGLWFSIAFEGRVECVSFAAALAVHDAVASLAPAAIKWPNDLLLNGRKFAGILVEHARGRTVAGIGINVHHTPSDFPEAIRDTATSLSFATGNRWNRTQLFHAVLSHLDRRVEALRSGRPQEVMRDWSRACDMKGRQVRYGKLICTVLGIDASGALLLDTPFGAHRLIAGDVRLLPECG
jgi:BirA family transcriptional regulator, biotin operon repressor / biotin---[acetyl-CoA-carboxylase] ligase